MTVQRVGADTRHEAIVALMRDALSQRPSLARVADRWAGPFLWAVLALAALAAAAWSVIDPARAVWVAVSVLIVTCPCALSLAVPAALVAAAGGLARRGVLVQRLDALEAMARLDRLFIDKTGTLTTQARRLQRASLVQASPALPCSAVAQAIAASLAAWSRHPLSDALAAATVQPAVVQWAQVEEFPGRGLSGRDTRGLRWRLGSREWAVDPAAAMPAAGQAGATQVWLGADDGACAVFDFDEALRDGAVEAMDRLRSMGYQLTLLSGDSPARAQRLAQQLQLHAAFGGVTPQGKLAELAAAQARGERVAMVGDGVNDAPVLARADVSLAMGQGALVARAQADAVLVANRPMDIVHTLAVARRAMGIVRQNMVWAVAYNAACVPLALAGLLPPWAAGLGMAASSVLVVVNALRVAR
jgi:Cu2+-exporting ATPase